MSASDLEHEIDQHLYEEESHILRNLALLGLSITAVHQLISDPRPRAARLAARMQKPLEASYLDGVAMAARHLPLAEQGWVIELVISESGFWVAKDADLAATYFEGTTTSRLKQTLEECIAGEQSRLEAQARIESVFREGRVVRSPRAAGAEAWRAEQAAQVACYEESEEFDLIRWNTNLSDTTCDRCRGLNGVTYIAGSAIEQDEYMGSIQAPPLHPACRCWISVESRDSAD